MKRQVLCFLLSACMTLSMPVGAVFALDQVHSAAHMEECYSQDGALICGLEGVEQLPDRQTQEGEGSEGDFDSANLAPGTGAEKPVVETEQSGSREADTLPLLCIVPESEEHTHGDGCYGVSNLAEVEETTPIISTWPAIEKATYGTLLENYKIDTTPVVVSVPGKFSWVSPEDKIPTVAGDAYEMEFKPDDSTLASVYQNVVVQALPKPLDASKVTVTLPNLEINRNTPVNIINAPISSEEILSGDTVKISGTLQADTVTVGTKADGLVTVSAISNSNYHIEKGSTIANQTYVVTNAILTKLAVSEGMLTPSLTPTNTNYTVQIEPGKNLMLTLDALTVDALVPTLKVERENGTVWEIIEKSGVGYNIAVNQGTTPVQRTTNVRVTVESNGVSRIYNVKISALVEVKDLPGYFTDENGVMAYKPGDYIDIQGLYKGAWQATTYNNQGYSIFGMVNTLDSTTATLIPSAGDKTTIKGSGGVTMKVNRPIFVNDGKQLVLSYEVSNTSAQVATFSLGGYTDVKIGKNDSAAISELETSEYKGFKMIGNEDVQFNFFGRGYANVTDLSDYCYAPWRTWDKDSVFAFQSHGNSVTTGKYDSAIGYSWKNKNIASGETQTLSVMIGIGGAGSDQDVASFAEKPTITKDIPENSGVASMNGNAPSLAVEASVTDGGELSYQWFVNTQNSITSSTAIAGATKSSYVPSTAAMGAFYYYCKVTNTLTAADGNTYTSSANSIITKLQVVPEPPPWIKAAGLGDKVAYDPTTGVITIVGSNENIQLTDTIIIPDGIDITIDLNGNNLLAPEEKPAIKPEDDAEVKLTISGGPTDGPQGAIIGSGGKEDTTGSEANGNPAIDFSNAGDGSTIEIENAEVKGGNGGNSTTGDGGTGGEGIKGNDKTTVNAGTDSSIIGGNGGDSATGNGGNGGAGVTGKEVNVSGGNTVGGNGGNSNSGTGGTGGAGAEGTGDDNKVNVTGGANTTGGNGGESGEGDGGTGGAGATGGSVNINGPGSSSNGGGGGQSNDPTGEGKGGDGGAGTEGKGENNIINVDDGANSTGGNGGDAANGNGGNGGTGASGSDVNLEGGGSTSSGGDGGKAEGPGNGGNGGAGTDGDNVNVGSDSQTQGGNGGSAGGSGNGGNGGAGTDSDHVIIKPDGGASGGNGGDSKDPNTGGNGGGGIGNGNYDDVNGNITGGNDGNAGESVAIPAGYDLRDGTGIHYLDKTPGAEIATAAWKAKGYSFSGWYTEPDGGGELLGDTPIKDNVYYAFWKKGEISVRTKILDLSEIADSLDNPDEGWSWNGTTLKVDGAVIDTANATALRLPAGAKIEVETDSINMIHSNYPGTSQKSYGIESQGNLSIKGAGKLDVAAGPRNSASYGIYAGQLELNDGIQLEMRGYTKAYLGQTIIIPEGGVVKGTATVGGKLGDAKIVSGDIRLGASGQGVSAKRASIGFIAHATVGSQSISELVVGVVDTVTFAAVTFNFKEADTLSVENFKIRWFSDMAGSLASKAPQGVTIVATSITELAATIDTTAQQGTYYFRLVVENGGETAISEVATLKLIQRSGVTGQVIMRNGAPVDSATVTLVRGQTTISRGITDSDGKYSFSQTIDYGFYNLVITKDGKTITVPVEINKDFTSKLVEIPDTGKQNTLIQTAANTPPVVADLNTLFDKDSVTEDKLGITEGDKAVISSGGAVEVKLTAEAKQTNAIAEDVQKIKNLAADATAEFLFVDLSAFKTVTPFNEPSNAPIALKELNALVSIIMEVPEDKKGEGLRVFRVHDYGDGSGKIAEELTSTPNDAGEYVIISKDYSTVELIVKRFSTYAFMKSAEYQVTVVGSEAVITGAGKYEPGMEISIDAGQKRGYSFGGWTSSTNVTFANASSATTTFEMPVKNVTITANWTQSGGKTTSKDKQQTVKDAGNATVSGDVIIKGDNTTVKVDEKQLTETIKNMNEKSTITVNVPGNSPEATVQISSKNLTDMADKEMNLHVKTKDVSYQLPTATEETLKELLGKDADLTKALVTITISKGDEKAAKEAQDIVAEHGGKMVLAPISVDVTVSYQEKTAEIKTLSAYAACEIAVTEAQAKRITTAVVMEPEGRLRQVPTDVYQKNGKWFAKVNALTNSVYVLIENQVIFTDTPGKWYADAVNEMGSRKILDGRGGDDFAGDYNITRAEFAAALVKALGLPADGTADFTDVSAKSWYSGAIATAVNYGIVNGNGGGAFRPNASITREDAMTMIVRAAKLTPFPTLLPARNLADEFSDYGTQSSWAEEAVAFNLNNGLIVGYEGKFRPKDSITRAETATVILKLLQRAELIDIRTRF